MRWEKYGVRDLAYSNWHRTIPHPARFIDIDHVEYCPYCNQALAYVETARDVGQAIATKCCTVTRNAALRAGTQGYLVLYKCCLDDTLGGRLRAIYQPELKDKIIGFRVRRIAPQMSDERHFSPDAWADHLLLLHEYHERKCLAAKRTA